MSETDGSGRTAALLLGWVVASILLVASFFLARSKGETIRHLQAANDRLEQELDDLRAFIRANHPQGATVDQVGIGAGDAMPPGVAAPEPSVIEAWDFLVNLAAVALIIVP